MWGVDLDGIRIGVYKFSAAVIVLRTFPYALLLLPRGMESCPLNGWMAVSSIRIIDLCGNLSAGLGRIADRHRAGLSLF